VGENERLLASLLLSPRFIIHLLYIIIEEPPKSFASDNKHRDPGAENIGTSRTQFLFFFVTIWCGGFFFLACFLDAGEQKAFAWSFEYQTNLLGRGQLLFSKTDMFGSV
jgi:hypothetical protein